MPFNTGTGTQCAIWKESSWGTAVTDTLLLNFLSETLDSEVIKTVEESLLASTAPPEFALMGMKASGDVSLILKPENAGFLFKAALGGTDTVTQNSGGVTGQHQHSIVPTAAAGTQPSYTVYAYRKQATRRYSGMKVDVAAFEAAAGDYVRATLTFKGKDESTGTAITTTSVPSKKSYKFVGATLSVGGTSYEFTKFRLEIRNNLEDGLQTSASGAYMTEPMHQRRNFVLTIDQPYGANDETLRSTNFLTETVVATVVLHMESPELITGSSKFRADITLANVAVLSQKTNVSGTGTIMTSITCEATAVSTTSPCTAVVYDGTNSAY